MKIVTLTALASEVPASSQTALRFSMIRRVCPDTPPGTICPVSGSMGSCPEQKSHSPARMAWESGTFPEAALSVWMTVFSILSGLPIAQGDMERKDAS